MTVYLSQILDKPVWDGQGQRLGRCEDILVTEVEQGYPPIVALALAPEKGQVQLVSADQIAWLSPSIILNSSTPPAFKLRGNELWLRKQVLDRQIVDTEGRRLVRVNDLQFTRASREGRFYLLGADVGTSSLIRRLGVEAISTRILRAFGQQPTEQMIPWQDVASIQPDAPIRLRVTRDKISQIPPADIAEIVSELDMPSGQALLETLDTETVADTIPEIDPELQTSLLTAMHPERAADVLEEMDPDDAADLLASLGDQDRSNLLELMEDADSAQVEKLLAYPEDTAGGIMTTEYVTIPAGLTSGAALDYLRRSPAAHEDETIYYVHIVDAEQKLRGVISLRDLVLADPHNLVDEIMAHRPVTVEPLTPQREVARLVARYNLLAVPVVDAEGVIQGIVTVDDAIDAILPTAWKKRLPRFF